VRARIFGAPAAATTAAQALSDFSRWLVPAAGCFLLAVGSLSQKLPSQLSGAVETQLIGTEWNRVDLSVQLAMRQTEPDRTMARVDPFSTSRTILAQPVSSNISQTNHSIQQ
jgi:hypothetical protein